MRSSTGPTRYAPPPGLAVRPSAGADGPFLILPTYASNLVNKGPACWVGDQPGGSRMGCDRRGAPQKGPHIRSGLTHDRPCRTPGLQRRRHPCACCVRASAAADRAETWQGGRREMCRCRPGCAARGAARATSSRAAAPRLPLQRNRQRPSRLGALPGVKRQAPFSEARRSLDPCSSGGC